MASAFFLGRDWFLLPVKVGDNEGCEGLQEKVDALKKKMHVDIPIKVREHPAIPWAAHGGCCYGAAGITVPSSEISEETREKDDLQIGILAHEISHIKHNDGPWTLVIVVVALAASIVFVWAVCAPAWISIAEGFAIIPTFAALSIRSRMQERAADVEANKYLTNSQRQAISDFFENHRLDNLALRNQEDASLITRVWSKIYYNSEGESLLGRLTHPTLKSRTEYFRAQITPERPKYRSFFRDILASLT